MIRLRLIAGLSTWLLLVGLFAPLTVQAKHLTGTTTTWFGQLFAGEGVDARDAFLDNPNGFVADASCNLTLADTMNNMVRKITVSTNVITRLAGTGAYRHDDGVALNATFRAPYDIDRGADGRLYVADTENDRIRIITDSTISTWLSGLKRPAGITIDGTTAYIADTNNNRILKATTPDGLAQLVATITRPWKLAVSGDTLYVVHNSTSFSKVSISTGTIVSIKTDLENAEGVAVYNGQVYVVAGPKGIHNEIWKYDPAVGIITRIANVPETEWYNHASDILFCNDKMYLLFSSGSSVFRLNVDGTNAERIAGQHRYGDQDGFWRSAVLGRPKSLVVSKDRSKVYLLENQKIKEFTLKTKTLRLLAGHANDNWRDGVGDEARLSGATQMVSSPDGTKLYFADRNNNRIRVLAVADQRMTTLAGAGAVNQFAGDNNGYAEGRGCPLEMNRAVAGCAYFNRPMGIAISRGGNLIYVADTENHRIRSYDLRTGRTRLIAGGTVGFKNGVGSAAQFNTPVALQLSPDGKKLYVVDQDNHAIRVVHLKTKLVTTLVGTGKAGYRNGSLPAARLSLPDSLALGTKNTLFVSEIGGQRIRRIDLARQTISLVAGTGSRGSTDGAATVATFHNPRGMVMLTSTYLLVADQINDLIRAVRLK
ncbi:MAG: hypothetical protein HY567_04270 [Candidatus Kerfeldbacteria bacterium]|nr:hypothetical protein [Candidatus Kerfeldbacteria bacterium]